jgi:hypothetical protein
LSAKRIEQIFSEHQRVVNNQKDKGSPQGVLAQTPRNTHILVGSSPPQAIRHLFQILETHHFYKEHQRTMERSTGEQHYRAASLPTNDMNAMTNLVASSLGVLALVGVVSLLDERFWLRPNQGFRRV